MNLSIMMKKRQEECSSRLTIRPNLFAYEDDGSNDDQDLNLYQLLDSHHRQVTSSQSSFVSSFTDKDTTHSISQHHTHSERTSTSTRQEETLRCSASSHSPTTSISIHANVNSNCSKRPIIDNRTTSTRPHNIEKSKPILKKEKSSYKSPSASAFASPKSESLLFVKPKSYSNYGALNTLSGTSTCNGSSTRYTSNNGRKPKSILKRKSSFVNDDNHNGVMTEGEGKDRSKSHDSSSHKNSHNNKQISKASSTVSFVSVEIREYYDQTLGDRNDHNNNNPSCISTTTTGNGPRPITTPTNEVQVCLDQHDQDKDKQKRGRKYRHIPRLKGKRKYLSLVSLQKNQYSGFSMEEKNQLTTCNTTRTSNKRKVKPHFVYKLSPFFWCAKCNCSTSNNTIFADKKSGCLESKFKSDTTGIDKAAFDKKIAASETNTDTSTSPSLSIR